MPSFESFGKGQKIEIEPEAREADELDQQEEIKGLEMGREQMKDFLFDQYMKQQLIEDFFDDLREYLDEDDTDEMRGELAKCDDEVIYSTLSLPKELRERKFSEFQNQIEIGKKQPQELMREFIEVSKRHGFGIGYHTSPSDIKPNEQGQWTIRGFESDHRDEDMSKAYYSTKYRHLFKKKDPAFIYIVRTDPSTHRTDGNWSRAGMLSVVTRVPFSDVVEYVEKNVADIEKKKAGD